MLNRLMGIIYVLMNKGTVTARELAERYEVSVRTIYRDVESLSMAGIPVYMRKGKNGGISLTEQFVLDKMLVTKEEQTQILSALVSLQQTGAQNESETLRKLGDFFKTEPMNWVAIDFSDWSERRQELFELLKKAILHRRVVCFDYYSQNGNMTERRVCPIQLFFKDYTWYLRAYCKKRKALRTFKLLRMKRVKLEEETFLPDPSWYEVSKQEVESVQISSMKQIDVLIDHTEAYRIYDKCEENEIEVLENGDFLVHMQYCMDDWVYGLILSFGPSAQVISPPEIVEEMRKRIDKMQERYKNNN